MLYVFYSHVNVSPWALGAPTLSIRFALSDVPLEPFLPFYITTAHFRSAMNPSMRKHVIHS